jgi:hypothetical protein
LLYVIEYVVNDNYLINPVFWFKTYALPITLIWLAIIWPTILVRQFIKLKIWITLGILFLLSILGSAFTNAISSQVSIAELYNTSFEWINSLIYFGSAIICFIIGYIRRGKCKI